MESELSFIDQNIADDSQADATKLTQNTCARLLKQERPIWPGLKPNPLPASYCSDSNEAQDIDCFAQLLDSFAIEYQGG